MTALMVLMDLVLLASCMKRRQLTVTYAGKVWSDELNTYVSVAEAYLAGIGKARRTKAEQQVFDLLLMDSAMKDARKALKARRTSRLDWDYERMLHVLIDIKERMARGMKLINQVKAQVAKLIEATGEGYAYYVLKAWSTPANKREYKQCKCLHHDNNQALIQALNWTKENPKAKAETKIQGLAKWLVREQQLWDIRNQLKAESDKLAAEYKLWPAYFQLEKLSFHNHGFDTRAAVRDEELNYNEKPSGLTGEWPVDTIGDMADNHVTEFAALERALKGCEYYKKWHFLKGDSRPAYTKKQVNGKWVLEYRHTKATDQLLDQAKARRLERQRDAWRAAAKMDEVVETNAAKKAAREARKAKRAAKKLAAVTTFTEENYSFKNEDAELHYMELLITSD